MALSVVEFCLDWSVLVCRCRFLAARKAAAALGKTFQAEAEDVRPISNFWAFFSIAHAVAYISPCAIVYAVIYAVAYVDAYTVDYAVAYALAYAVAYAVAYALAYAVTYMVAYAVA